MIKFTTKKNREIEIIEATMEWLDEILRFVHVLAEEDTFLSFHPAKVITRDEEEVWLKNVVERQKNNAQFLYWAIYDNKIVGSVDIHRGFSVRDWHIGTIGLMVDKEFRREGLGKFLLQFILEQAKKAGIRTAILDVFSDNEIARSLYKKVGFSEFGCLPDGFYRKNKFSDRIWMYKHLLK